MQPILGEWIDHGVSVSISGSNGRYAVRYPTQPGTGVAPDFTVREEALDYAAAIARAIRFQREVTHGAALQMDAERKPEPKATTLELVLRDSTTTRWVLIGPGLYILADWIKRGRPFHDSLRRPRAYIEEKYGPVTVEHSIEIKGELATAPYPSEVRNA
jgi:hypothetical protein